MSVHSLAKAGFGIGNELYDRARPSYQPFALAYMRDVVRSSSSVNVVEIGSGTGIFTRALLAHPDWSSSVKIWKAIEPSEGMRDVFSRTVKDDRVTVSEGTFDNTGVESGWADLVVIAQAYHWCSDYGTASVEFARILKPNGVVVYIWNLEDREGARWVAQLRERIESHEKGTPQFRLNLWRQTFDTPAYKELFQAPEERVWSYILPGTLQVVMDRACSKSYIAVLPEDEKVKVKEDVKNIVLKGEDKVWMNENQGVFEYPYKTWVVVAKKK